MITKVILLMAVILLIIGCTSASTKLSDSSKKECDGVLWNYSNLFISDTGKFNGKIVVGVNGATSDLLAGTDIRMGLRYKNAEGYLVPPESSVFDLVYDSDISTQDLSQLKSQNFILIGNPCDNIITHKMLNKPENCKIGLNVSESIIKIIKHAEGGVSLLVMGFSPEENRIAAKVLVHGVTELRGNEMIIQGDSSETAKINCAG